MNICTYLCRLDDGYKYMRTYILYYLIFVHFNINGTVEC